MPSHPLRIHHQGTRWFLSLICGGGLLLGGLEPAWGQAFKPPQEGAPVRRVGGGTRGGAESNVIGGPSCLQGQPAQAIALLPTSNIGLTTQDYPRFFWYMPATKAKFAEFSLHTVEEKNNATLGGTKTSIISAEPLYISRFQVSGQGGIASLGLPSNATLPPLSTGQKYYWSLTLICNSIDRDTDIVLDGWVRRVEVEAPLKEQLAIANPRQKFLLYANNGLWFDAVTTLADLRKNQPNDTTLTADWVSFMGSVNLQGIANQPLLVDCCLAQTNQPQ